MQPTLVASLALAGLLAACSPAGPDLVVDGWPIGERLECSSLDCATYLQVASAGLDRRDAGHAQIVESALHDQGTYELEDGSMYVAVCSGSCPLVAVFKLADGATRAIGVGTPGVSAEVRASDWGPALHWEPPRSSTTP